MSEKQRKRILCKFTLYNSSNHTDCSVASIIVCEETIFILMLEMRLKLIYVRK